MRRPFWRLPIWVFCVSVWLLAADESAAWAQTQSGTLQLPAKPQHDQPHDKPTTAPSAAPRTPVQKGAQKSGPAIAGNTPVVPPHGPVHPEKPKANQTKPSVAVPVKPPPPVPPNPPAAAEPPASAVEKLPEPEKPESVPAKLPRFASLRSDDVNMRAGPGTRYRIDWVYRRRDLPVEIEREFDVWRWVRDPDGIQGWVHQATLMGRRSFIVEKAEATLRSDASDTAPAVAILKPGVIGRIRSCAAGSDWCEVQTGSYRGYLRRQAFWGLLPGEAINP
jgi:SH3-like domain-containing protein